MGASKIVLLARNLEQGYIEARGEFGYGVYVTAKIGRISVPYERGAPDLKLDQRVLVHERPEGYFLEELPLGVEAIEYPYVKGGLMKSPPDINGIILFDPTDTFSNHSITIGSSDADLERLEKELSRLSPKPRPLGEVYHGSNKLVGKAYTTLNNLKRIAEGQRQMDGTLIMPISDLTKLNADGYSTELKPLMLEYCVECALL